MIGHIAGIAGDWSPTVTTVIFEIRLPRILAALLIGAAMSLSGASYQGMFKNPMVSPDILGASAGAGFGAAMAILASLGTVGIQVSAFFFGLAAVAITLEIGKTISRGNNVTLGLVLTGMVVSTLFQAFISITKYVADPDSKLPAITFWLMGGLSSVGPKEAMRLLVILTVGSVPLFLVRWKLNVLSFGDEESQALGVNVRGIRFLVIACSTLLTAACVSVCGLVGWIGLVIPHIARLIVGPNFKTLIPASAIIGGAFLIVVDDIARCAFAIEIPLGILTALVGAPFFLCLLMRERKGWV
jgi:iron complex transport system permease protein